MIEALRATGFVVVATGLRAEARIVAGSPRVRAIAGGGASDELEDQLWRAIAEGGEALISFGLAAGLAPDLTAGSCIVGREVVHGGMCYSTNLRWASRLKTAIARAEMARIAGVDRSLGGVSEKRALYAASGAAAADMESHIVGADRSGKRTALCASYASSPIRPSASCRRRRLQACRSDGSDRCWRGARHRSRETRVNCRRSFGSPPILGARRATLLRCHDLLGPGLGFGDFG